MSEWVPVVAGFGLIVSIIELAKRAPRSWMTAELHKWYGAKPRGPYLTLTRRDQARRGMYSALAAIALIASAFALSPLTERFPNGSRTQLTVEAYFFVAFILGALAAFAGLIAFGSAAFWRPRRVKLSDTGTLDLVSYFGLLGADRLASNQWRDFSAIRFEDEHVEAMRRELVNRIGNVPRDLTETDREWLQRAMDRLLDRVQPESNGDPT